MTVKMGASEKKEEYGMDTQQTNADGSTTVTSEKARLVEKRRHSAQTARRLHISILVISWFSVIVLGALGLITLVISIIENSSASFAFAFSALLDACTSSVVVWTFSGYGYTHERERKGRIKLDAWLDCLSSIVVIWRFSKANQLYSAKREKIACIALGCLFLVSSVVIISKSSIALASGSSPAKSNLIWYLSLVNGVTCLGLVFAKVYLAKRLESIAVGTDAINSGIGFVLAVSTLVSDIVYDHYSSVWYLDAVVGIVCAFFLLIYGVWVIIYETMFAVNTDDHEEIPDDD